MKVIVNGKTIILDNKSFIAQGGEGSVYVKGKTAYKIYEDPKNMIAVGKIQELSLITSSNVIKPKKIIFNEKNKPIGYTMDFINNAYPLCQVFTKAFKSRHGLKPKHGLKLISNMQNTIKHIHDKNILVVDMNEMNFLVDEKFSDVFFIDVDSYQTPSFNATALMESVRDRQSVKNVFNEGTDWFAFSIVSFQIMTGIHPFKGTHPTLKGFEDRMINNMSVYSNEVKVPKVVSDFKKIIPKALSEWYQNVFQNGLRCEPPDDYKNCESIKEFVTTTIKGSNNFIIDTYKEFDKLVINYFYFMGCETIITENNAHFRSSNFTVKPSTRVVFNKSTPDFIYISDDKLIVNSYKGAKQTMDAKEFMTYENRIYYRYDENIMELIPFNNKYVSKLVATTMPNATKMYDGVSIQNMLGNYRAALFPDTGICYHIKLEELNGYQIIDAKHERNILMIVGFKKGKYDQFIFCVDKNKIISKRKIEDISFNGINFTVLDKNIVIAINEKDQIEIFSTINIKKLKIVEDENINGKMTLFSKGSQVIFADGQNLYKLGMK